MGIVTLNNKIVTKGGNIVISNVADHIQYGWLYNWYAVTNAHGLAPAGYHIPTKTEWETLVTTLGGTNVAGGKMKESGTTHWQSPNTGATNESGFTALPGGHRYECGSFIDITTYCHIWSSTEVSYDQTYAYFSRMQRDNAKADVTYNLKYYGKSVRCIRDNDTGWDASSKMIDIDGNLYDTVKIGDQIWTVQNLSVSRYKNGTNIPKVNDYTDWTNDTTGARCAYDTTESYVFN